MKNSWPAPAGTGQITDVKRKNVKNKKKEEKERTAGLPAPQ
jgi:hypothetical protein